MMKERKGAIKKKGVVTVRRIGESSHISSPSPVPKYDVRKGAVGKAEENTTEKVRQKKAVHKTPSPKKKQMPFTGAFSNKIGIDLGTASTIVYVEGRGIILVEPTLVAVNMRTRQVVAVGDKARVMIGRTPEHIEVIQPVQQGVVYDYDVTEQLFEYIFRKVQDVSSKIFGPTVIVGVPCRTSPTEINAVKDAATDAGARQVYVVYEPFAAAIGIGLSLEEERSSMIVDIGGGTSDIMILVGNEIIASDSIRMAGNEFDRMIMEGMKEKMQLAIGIRTAEDLKMAIMQSADERKTFSVQGRSVVNGLPFETEVTFDEMLSFINPCIEKIVAHINKFIKQVSPEVLADLQNNNIYFVGGGPSIHSFSEKLEEALNLKVTVPENPISIVAHGTSIIAQNPKRYTKYFL